MNRIKMNWKKITAVLVMAVIYIAVLIVCNDIDKKEMISTDGRTFEKAVVTEITKDNLYEDGSCAGNQEVILRINSGELK